jgi:hypothetical protein
MLDEFPNVIKETSAAVLVVDGLTNTDKQILAAASTWYKFRINRLILVSSLQVNLRIEDYQAIQMKEIRSSGWSIEEYEAACADEEFLASIQSNLDADSEATDIKEKISAKYFIAGASVRWMFAFNTKKAVYDIKECINKTDNINVIMQGLAGNRRNIIVNHLLTVTKENASTIVSQFVARELARRCDSAFIRQVTIVAATLQNASFDGWLFQMDFLSRLTLAVAHQTPLTFTNSTEQWYASAEYQFYDESELEDKLPYWNTRDNTWYIPTKINQGCYDVLQLCGTTLRMVQITVASQHSLKLHYLIRVIEILYKLKINITVLDIVVVVPPSVVSTFHMSSSQVMSDKHQTIRVRVSGTK